MEPGKSLDITHLENVCCNAKSVEKFLELIVPLWLEPEDCVLEIATGKGEFVIPLVERYEVKGMGIDKLPYRISYAGKEHQQRMPDARVSFAEIDGADDEPKARESFN